MSFPILLVCAFLASLSMGLLKTGRWKVALIVVVVVWCVRLGQTEMDLLSAGTTQAYAWFALLSAMTLFPTFVVAMIGADLGMRLYRALFAKDEEAEETPEPQAAESEEATEA